MARKKFVYPAINSKEDFFACVSGLMKEGNKIQLKNGTYEFVVENMVICSFSENNGFKGYYTPNI